MAERQRRVAQPGHDASTVDGRKVQIKGDVQGVVDLSTVPECYLGFKLYPYGSHEEVFNGPGALICQRYAGRKGAGSSLLSFPITELRRLSSEVAESERVPKRQQGLAERIPEVDAG